MTRILIVEDNEDARLALSTILKDAGYEVVEAADGSEVVDRVLKVKPDLILLDIIMPRIDGFDVLAMLKADERTRNVPVVMVTAKGRPSDLHKARTLGAIDYINKPWADGEVELRVSWILRKRRRGAPGRTPTGGLPAI